MRDSGLAGRGATDGAGVGDTGGDMSFADAGDDMFAEVLVSGLCPMASVVVRLVVAYKFLRLACSKENMYKPVESQKLRQD